MIKIIGGDFSGNGGSGISLGKGAKAEITGATTNNNGNYGIGYHSESDITLVNHTALNNKSHGLYQIDSNLLESFGLPKNIDVDEFSELVDVLQHTLPDKREGVIKSSFLAGTLALYADATTIVMNILDYVEKLPPLFK